MLRLFFLWVLLLSLLSCSSTVSEQAVKEVASNAEMIAADVPNYWDNPVSMSSKSLWRNRNLISAIVSIDGSNCGVASSLLQPTEGEDKSALENLFIPYDCRASNDRGAVALPAGSFWYYRVKRDRSFDQYFVESEEPKLRWVEKGFMASENEFTPQELDEFCAKKRRCPSSLQISMFFARANYFDRINRRQTAAIWRLQGIMLVASSKTLRKEHGQEIIKHLKQAYRAATDASDLALATWVIHIWEEAFEDLNQDMLSALLNHKEGWSERLSNQKAPVGYSIPLVGDTFLSDYHYVGYRGVQQSEFKIDIVEGAVDHAFLNCNWLFGYDRQVRLQVDLKRGWKIPEGWGSCRLILFGKKGTRVKIWEYPDGSLDDNGNLSA
ncbi:hypothetical protein N9L28_04755 [Luminiphilus sp.]|nr:hypothetical protein [Luminiphilus sp.]